jgi:hypothetical protein
MRLTFARPVLDGYERLELAYDGHSLAPVAGRLIGEGLPDVDWTTARPLLEASLIPFGGLEWRRVTQERIRYRVHSWDKDLPADRLVEGGVEYGWAAQVPWWLWYKMGDQIRADLVDCSCWRTEAVTPLPLLPWSETPAPPAAAAAAQTAVLDYQLVLKEDRAGKLIVAAQRSGELTFEDRLRTQVISLAWDSPERRMHVYLCLLPGAKPQVTIDKVVVTEPVYTVWPQNVSAVFVGAQASLEARVMVGKVPYVLEVGCALR